MNVPLEHADAPGELPVPHPEVAATLSTKPDASPRQRWSMKLVWAGLAYALVVLAYDGWQAHSQRERATAVRCDRPIFDFKQAFAGDVIQNTFHVINVGRVPITISQVKAECGCTTVASDLEGKVIAPQQSFDVPVTLRLPPAEKGNVQKKVTVLYREQSFPSTTLRMKGAVESRWHWSPETLVFDNVPADRPTTKTVVITQNPAASLSKIDQVVAAGGSMLQATVAPHTPSEDNREWVMSATTVPPLSGGRKQTVIYFYATDNPTPVGIPVTLIVTKGQAD